MNLIPERRSLEQENSVPSIDLFSLPECYIFNIKPFKEQLGQVAVLFCQTEGQFGGFWCLAAEPEVGNSILHCVSLTGAGLNDP